MPRLKAETLSIRTTNEIKQLLRFVAERERRSVASMIEVLVLDYAKLHGVKAELGASARSTQEVLAQAVRHKAVASTSKNHFLGNPDDDSHPNANS